MQSKYLLFFLPLALGLAPGRDADAAACCGTAFGAPALIANDDALQVTLRGSSQVLSREVAANGLWRRPEQPENLRSLRLEAATIFADRWQTGWIVPITERRLRGRSSAGLGDLSANLGYELITDWDYNPWRPRGLIYLQALVPTGKPWPLASERSLLDTHGRGFWALGLGFLLNKSWGSIDAFASAEAHRALPRDFATPTFRGRLEPGWGTTIGFGGGYSFAALRLGASITWAYEDPVRLAGPDRAAASLQRFATVAVDSSYLLAPAWALSLAYLDQTRWGHPLNTSLGRGFALSVQRRWAR